MVIYHLLCLIIGHGKSKTKKTFILSRYYLDDQQVEDTPPRNNVYEHHEPRPLLFENLDTEGKLPCNIAEASLTSSGSATKFIPLKPQPNHLPQMRSCGRVLSVNSGQGQITIKNKNGTQAAPTKANKTGKPTIPDDIKDVLLSAGIDEKNAADVVVYSNIENFRESCSKINNSELKERLTIVRRQWKYRNCAEKSRTNRIERIKGMREEFQRELKKLKDNQKTMAKYQVNAKNNRHTFKH